MFIHFQPHSFIFSASYYVHISVDCDEPYGLLMSVKHHLLLLCDGFLAVFSFRVECCDKSCWNLFGLSLMQYLLEINAVLPYKSTVLLLFDPFLIILFSFVLLTFFCEYFRVSNLDRRSAMRSNLVDQVFD